jgi:hypothetical protein
MSVESLQNEIAQQRTIMGAAYAAFLNHVEQFLVEWFESESRGLITTLLEQWNRLSETQKKSLREEVDQLKENVTAIVREHVGKQDLWWHFQEQSHLSYKLGPRTLPQLIEQAVRLACGELAAPFEKAGLLPTSPNSKARLSAWRRSDVGLSGQGYYPGNLGLPSAAAAAMQQYAGAHHAAATAKHKLETIQAKDAKDAALLEWSTLSAKTK